MRDVQAKLGISPMPISIAPMADCGLSLMVGAVNALDI
jgi:hypothetical protein